MVPMLRVETQPLAYEAGTLPQDQFGKRDWRVLTIFAQQSMPNYLQFGNGQWILPIWKKSRMQHEPKTLKSNLMTSHSSVVIQNFICLSINYMYG